MAYLWINLLVFLLGPQSLRISASFTPLAANFESLRVGCFSEIPTSREFVISAGNYNSSTLHPLHCTELCGRLGYEYAALQNGNLCFCGRTYGTHGVSTYCNKHCTGDPSKICGGSNTSTVYNASVYIGNFAIREPVGTFRLFSEVNLTVVFTNGTVSNPGYSLDLGEGSGYSITRRTRDGFLFRLIRWGELRISARNTVSGELSTVYQKLQVHSPVKHVNILCPGYVASNASLHCTVRVYRGTDMRATWSFNSGLTGSVYLPDPSFIRAGPPVPQWTVPNVASNFTGVFLIPSSQFLEDAMVLGVEMYGHTAGNVKVFVARPVCSEDANKYCVKKYACTAANDSCSALAEHQCFPPQVLGASISACQLAADCNCSAPAYVSFPPTLPSVDYTIVCELGSFDIKVAYNMFVLPDNKVCKTEKGDIICWSTDGGGGKVGHRPGGSKAFQFSSILTSSVQKGFNITQPHAHIELRVEYMLNAFGSEAATFVSNHVLAAPGRYRYHVNVTNNLTSSHVISQQYIKVQQSVSSIKGAYPNGFDYFGAYPDRVIELAVNISSATNLTVVWKNTTSGRILRKSSYLENAQKMSFLLDKMNYSFSALGRSQLLVKASNQISSVNTTVTILITRDITGLRGSLLYPDRRVYKGLATVFNASVLAGVDVLYRWLFGNEGSTDFIDSNSTTVTFSRTGVFNVTVIASNQASQVRTSFLVQVLDPVVMSSPPWAPINTSVTLNCSLVGSFSVNKLYIWDFGNGKTASILNMTTVQHIFSRGGKLKVTCTIQDPVLLNSSISIFILEPLTGLSIKPFPGVELNDNKTFTATYTTGNNLTFEWFLKGPLVRFLAVCSINTLTYNFNSSGLYSIIVNASNAISVQSYRRTFLVEENITGVAINAYPNPAPSNTTVRFNVTKGTGTNVTYKLDFSDGFVVRNFDGPFLEFNRTFLAGKKQIILNAENVVSHMIIFYNLTVQDVIKNISVTVDADAVHSGVPYVALRKQKQLKAEVKQGTDVYFEWNMNGISIGRQKGNVQALGNTFGTRSHTFTSEREFRVNVTAVNLVSSLSGVIRINVEEEIEGFDVDMPKAKAPGEEVTLRFTNTRGRNVTYVVRFGDSSVTTTQDTSIKKIYATTGSYSISATAINKLGSRTINKTLFIQFKIQGFSLTRELEPAASGESFAVFWKILNGSDVTVRFTFGDGSPEVNVTSQPLGVELSVNHSYSAAGRYEMKITAVNLVGPTISVVRSAEVEDRIVNFTATVRSTSVKLDEEVVIETTIAQGTGVIYSYDFGDNLNIEKTSETRKTHRYYFPNVFTPRVTAQNLLGPISVSTANVTVKIPERAIKISGLQISCPPSVLGNLSKISVKWETGFLFRCTLKYGDGDKGELTDTELRSPVLHKYPRKEGSFLLFINCSNSEGSTSSTGEAKVDELLSGLNFTNGNNSLVYATFGERKRVYWLWTGGTNIVFTIDLLSYGRIYDITTGQKTGHVDLEPSFFSRPGDFVLKVRARNSVTQTQFITITISIIQPIETPKLSVNPFVRVGFPAMAFVTMVTGSHALSVWSYGDGSSPQFLKSGSSGNFIKAQHNYIRTGVYTIEVGVWNRITAKNATISTQVAIEYPVLGFTMPRLFTVYTTTSKKVKFEFVRDESKPAPTNASYYFEFGNGVTSELKTLNPAQSRFSLSYEYNTPGCRTVRLIISNNASRMLLKTTVRLLKRITDLELSAHHSEDSATPGEPGKGPQYNMLPLEYPISLKASHANDTCIKYDWYFGDEENVIGVTMATVSHSYPLPGNYTVRVRAYNDGYSEEKRMKVIVMRSVVGVFLASSSPAKRGANVTFVVFYARPGTGSTFVLHTGEGRHTTFEPGFNSALSAEKYINQKLPFNAATYYASVLNHTYQRTGIYKAKVEAWNEVSRHTARATVVVTDVNCRLPGVGIYGGGATVRSAPSVVYGEDFELTSLVIITCESSKKVEAVFRWDVYTADVYYGNGSSMPPDNARIVDLSTKIIRNQSSIIVPKWTLQPGTYLFHLNVSLSEVGLESTDQQYINIAIPGVEAVIEGGSAKSHGWELKLLLNASESRDLMYPSNKVSYAWYCMQIENAIIIGKGGCFGNGDGEVEWEEATYPIRARSLFESVTYNFTVKVTSRDKRSASMSQLITVVPGQPPNIKISCISNGCGGGKVTSSKRLVLHTFCDDCNNSSDIEYTWTAKLNDSINLDLWPKNTLTTSDMPYAVIKERTFLPDNRYVLMVEAGRKGGNRAFVKYEFYTNSPPSGGHCDINPKEGQELETKYGVTCRDWKEEDTPLTYEILLEVSTDQHVLMWYGPEPEKTTIILAAGKKENNYTQNLIVRARDVYGAVNDTHFTIRVSPLTGTITSQRLLSFTDGKGSKMEKALARGNLQEATQLTAVIGNILNQEKQQNQTSGDRNSLTVKEKTKVREVLTNAMDRVVIRDLQAVRQVSGAIQVIAHVDTELSSRAQDSAHRIYSRIAKIVKFSSKSRDDSLQIEHAIRTALSGMGRFISASSKSVNDMFLQTSGGGSTTSELQQYTVSLQRTSSLLESTNIMAGSIEGNKVPGEDPTNITTRDLALVVQKLLPEKLSGSVIKAGSQGEFKLPSSEELFSQITTKPTSVGFEMLELQRNPFTGSYSSSLIKSPAISLILKDPKRREINITELTSYIDIYLHSKKPPEQKELNNSQTPLKNGDMSFHKVQILNAESSITADIMPYNKSVTFDVYFRYNTKPTLTDYNLKVTLPRAVNRSLNYSSPGPFTFFVSSTKIKKKGNYYFGVLPAGNMDTRHQSPVNYTFDVYSSGCYYWDDNKGAWSTDGCEVGNKTTRSVTHCQCKHLTWFGANLFVPPNEIDFNEAIKGLKNIHESPALLATFCIILGVYVLAMVWARRRDKADKEKVGLVAVPENDISDEYRYEVIVYTGRGKTAATTSNVSLIITGELGQSYPISLKDHTRPVFEPAGVDSFLVTNPNPLGPLNYIRVWHDNTGNNASWYLNQIVIRNIENNERFFFLCYRWFACDEGDGQVDRVLPVAGKEELGEFIHLFRSKTARDFSDAHLWFSIALRPARSQFTRVQRVTCCLSLLVCTMLANVLWYDVPRDKNDAIIFESGFIRITWNEVIIGIQSSLIVFPINLMIVQIFRNIEASPRQKKQQSEKAKQVLSGSPQKAANRVRTLTLNDIKATTRDSTDLEDDWLSENDTMALKKPPQIKVKKLSSIKRAFITKQDSFDDDLMSLLIETRLVGGDNIYDGYPCKKNETKSQTDQIPLECLTNDEFHDLYCQEIAEKASPSPVSEASVDCVDSAKPLFKPRNVKTSNTKKPTTKKKLPKQKYLLPWWVAFIGWFLCFTTAATAGFLTILWGNHFDQDKQHQWLLSMFFSIVQDIFISQPLKVIGFALFVALVLKRPQDEDDDAINAELAQNEEWLQQNVGRARRRNALTAEEPMYMPPNPAMLKKARVKRFKERKMFSVIREISFYAMFVWVVLLIAYGHRDPNAHLMNQGLENILNGKGNSWLVDYAPPKPRNRTITKFLKVSDVKKFWNWTKTALIPGLYSGPWYNGREDKSGFMSDRSSWIVGVARLRQLRVKTGTCQVAEVFDPHFPKCNDPYSWQNEDTTKYYRPGWQEAPQNYTTTDQAWQYRTSTELESLPFLGRLALYSGGGYALRLGPDEKRARKKIEDLETEGWIDKATRAVFTEFTVYNPNTNLYSVGYLLLEVSSSGGTFPFGELLVTRIDRYSGNFKIFVLLCEVSFVVFIIIFTYKETKHVIRDGVTDYFQEYWNWVEVFLIGFSWTAIVLYFVRFGINKLTKNAYLKDPNKFVNFHTLAASDQLYGYIYAFVVFLVSLKFLRLFRFNRRMSLLATTLKVSSKELAHFGIVFSLVFMAFIHFCFLVFSNELYIFHTVISTIETLISVMLGKFSYERLLQTNRILAPCMFFFYSIVVVFILINMFISIIIENFQQVKSNNDLQSNEHEIVDFMMEHFKAWLGWNSWGMFLSGNRIRDSSLIAKPEYKKKKKYHQAEVLKNRIDRLVMLIQKVHFEEEVFLRNDGEVTYLTRSDKYEESEA